MKRIEIYNYVINYFEETMPVAETELNYTSPFELVVSVILSAQCTDKRVNLITPVLFKKFPSAEKMAKASQNEVFELIKSCTYPNNKSKHLISMSKILINNYKGIVPSDIYELQKLPGVGRKTANVIAAVVYNKPTIAVDTHVFRVSARIGLVRNAKTPLATEKQLMRFIPEELRPKTHQWLILHGRYICIARKPKCNECGLKSVCIYYKSMNSVK